MSETMSEQELLESIKAKSDQLNAVDLVGGSITVTIKDVRATGDAKQPASIIIDGGHQPYKPCKTMRRVLIAVWGAKAPNWIGKRMTLFREHSVMYAGVQVGGIQISHVSGIEKPVELNLSSARGKKQIHRVEPLGDATGLAESIIACLVYFRLTLKWDDQRILEAIGKTGIDQIDEADIVKLRAIAKQAGQ